MRLLFQCADSYIYIHSSSGLTASHYFSEHADKVHVAEVATITVVLHDQPCQWGTSTCAPGLFFTQILAAMRLCITFAQLGYINTLFFTVVPDRMNFIVQLQLKFINVMWQVRH